jgi:serine O-acetyltransferase
MRQFRETITKDLEVFRLVHPERQFLKYVYHADFKVVFLFRLSQMCYRHKLIRPFAYLIATMNDFLHGVWIGPKVQIGPGFFAGHPRGLVVNPSTKVGKNFAVVQQVGIGGPNVQIGNNVEINAGAKIISNIRGKRSLTIGNNVIVAAGAIVINDVPDNCIVAGVPAKVVKEIQDEDNWIEFRKNLANTN